MPRSVTQQEVAQLAGVSYQTVSRVINHHLSVAPTTRERVLNAIQQLGYQPNAIARGLASRRTRILALITSDFGDYFFTQVIIGAEQVARNLGYLCILGTTQHSLSNEPEDIQLMPQYQIDGLFLVRPSIDAENETSHYLAALLQDGVPIVATESLCSDGAMPVVSVDNAGGGYQATQHLVELGHQRIAMITGRPISGAAYVTVYPCVSSPVPH